MSRRLAPPPTPPRKRHRTVPRALYRWLVIGPTSYPISLGPDYYDPLEPRTPVVYVDAWTKTEAKVLAMRTAEFDEHLTEALGDRRCPFTGVTAERLWALLP